MTNRKSQKIIRRTTGALLSAVLTLGVGGETIATPNSLRSDIGRAAMLGAISVSTGLPESFGGAVASVVSIDARDAAGKLLLHASGVKIGPNKILTAGHIIYDLRGGDYGPEPRPGYCATNPGFGLMVGFSTHGGQGSEVHVTGASVSNRRDLAVLTVDDTSLFDKIPSAPTADLSGHNLSVTGKGIIMAGYPAHANDGLTVQDPSLSGHDANVYVWTGPVDPLDDYAATITLPIGIAGGGTSGGPIISGDKVVGIVHGGAVSPGAIGTLLIEHTVGVRPLTLAAPQPVCP